MASYEQLNSSASSTAVGQEQILAIKQGKKDGGIKVVAKNDPVTSERLPAIYANQFIDNPGVARGNVAASVDTPDGDREWAGKVKDYTPLQQHILFWDPDGDGQIYPWDVYVGFRDLGFNIIFSILAVLIINVNFSYPTRLAHSWLPDPWFRVYVSSVHKAKHGSDSNTYDPEGRFNAQHFEENFSKFDSDNDGALTLRDLFSLTHGNRCAADTFGVRVVQFM
ncbi:hypothetical protein N8T08_005372 [Aspergillus melleus]|uniref:Uncharacterized protein n=1 Tax=Aspergillus melleus TaxID=138277 RepID=A0ACC3B291_9EURO|nr:hypothetical protein N8T08_005372 [Aspergillus melleus]